MALHSTVLIALVLLFGATVPCFAEEAPKQTFTCTAKTFNECLMEAPCSAWKRSGPKGYQLEHQNHLPRQSRGRRNYFGRHYG